MGRTAMDHRLSATPAMAREFSELFVNRRAYTIQSMRPHPESGRHYYYRPKSKDVGKPTGLSLEIVRQHLAGELTIGIYAINPATQRCKWMAIDADYKTALEDLIKVQRQLLDDGVAAALEKSKRGGHLWMFFEQPVMARHARTYIYHVAQELEVQVKGAGLSDGIEIFPKQDELRRSEEHTSELQSQFHLVCRLLLEKKKKINILIRSELRVKLDLYNLYFSPFILKITSTSILTS